MIRKNGESDAHWGYQNVFLAPPNTHQKEHDYKAYEDEGNLMKYLMLSGDRARMSSPEHWINRLFNLSLDEPARDAFETMMKERFMYGEKKQPMMNKGNQPMEGVTNWENSSSDGDRFSQQESVNGNGRKNLKSFDQYLVKKQKRAKEKLEKAKNKQVIKNEEINTSAYTNWH